MAPPPAKKKKFDCSIYKQQKQRHRRHSFAPALCRFTPSVGARKSVRAARKARKRLRQINVCDDVWLSILPCFGTEEVGLKLAPLSRRFDGLVDVHFRTRKWVLEQLKIRCATNGTGAEVTRKNDFKPLNPKCPFYVNFYKSISISSMEMEVPRYKRIRLPIPLPQDAPPVSLVGFKHISIHYIDNTVIAFMHRILQLCKSGITLKFLDPNKQSLDVISRHIMPHFKTAITRMELRNGKAVALYEWLHTPCGDGRPKMMHWFKAKGTLDEIKTNFLNATTPVSYIFLFYSLYTEDHVGKAPFELVNGQTRERLTFKKCMGRRMLERSPVARDEKQWKKWEIEAANGAWVKTNNALEICIDDV
uniref:F-box domain-containing protein n=1 Tax=Globodera rostochiensis TaxID=31243 RepID=A0A914HJ32_GLORO